MQGRRVDYIKKEFSYLNTLVALYFHPNAFSLMLSTIEVEANRFCYSTAAKFAGNDQTHKSYVIHGAIKIGEQFRYVYATETQVFTVQNQILKEAPPTFKHKEASFMQNGTLLQAQHNLNDLEFSLACLSSDAENLQDEPNIKTASMLVQSQKKLVSAQVAINFESDAKKAEMAKFLAETRIQLDARDAELQSVELELTGFVMSTESSKNFYAREMQKTREALTNQKRVIQTKLHELNDKQSEFNTAVDTAQKNIEESILSRSINFKAKLLAAVYQTASEIFQEIDGEEQIAQFNKDFLGFAAINKSNLLIHSGDHFLQAPLTKIQEAISALLKNLNSGKKIPFRFSLKATKEKFHKNLKNNLIIQLTNHASYVAIADEGLKYNLAVAEFAAGENAVKEAQIKFVAEEELRIKKHFDTGNNSALCEGARKTAKEVVESANEYESTLRLQEAVYLIHSAFNKLKSALYEFIKQLSHILDAKLALDPNDPELVTLRNLRDDIKNKRDEIENFLTQIELKKRALNLDPQLSYTNVSQEHNKWAEILCSYVKHINGDADPRANLSLLTGSIEKTCDAIKNQFSVKMLPFHPKYQAYLTLLADLEASKKELEEIELSNPLETADTDCRKSSTFKSGAVELIDLNNLASDIIGKKSAIDALRSEISQNLEEARNAKATLVAPSTLTYETVSDSINTLQRRLLGFRQNLDKIRSRSKEIQKKLSEQKTAGMSLLIDKNILVIDLCHVIVSIIQNNQYWSQQVTARGTRSLYKLKASDPNFNVPAGIAEMQSEIAKYESHAEGQSWYDNPVKAQQLLIKLKVIARLKVDEESYSCLGLFPLRKTTSRYFYNKLNELDVPSCSNSQESIDSFSRSLRANLGIQLEAQMELRKMSRS